MRISYWSADVCSSDLSETGEAGASAATGAGAALRLGFLAAGFGLTSTVLARVRRAGAGFAGAASATTRSGASATGGAGASSATGPGELLRLPPTPSISQPSLRAAEYHFATMIGNASCRDRESQYVSISEVS